MGCRDKWLLVLGPLVLQCLLSECLVDGEHEPPVATRGPQQPAATKVQQVHAVEPQTAAEWGLDLTLLPRLTQGHQGGVKYNSNITDCCNECKFLLRKIHN